MKIGNYKIFLLDRHSYGNIWIMVKIYELLMQSNEDDFTITKMIAINSILLCKKVTGTKKEFLCN